MTKTQTKKIKSFFLWYNSYLSYETTVLLDVEDSQVRYKSSFRTEPGRLDQNEESVYLCDRQKTHQFADYALITTAWEPKYGFGICIDGYYWRLSLTFQDGNIFESYGENGKPEDFDEFLDELESLIGKPLAYDEYQDYEITIPEVKRPQNYRIYSAVIGERWNAGIDIGKYYELIITRTSARHVILVILNAGELYNNILVERDRLVILLDGTVHEICHKTGTLLGSYEIRSGWVLFRIYHFGTGYAIHGEAEIIKLNKEFNEEWSFSGRDIFVKPDNGVNFEIKNGRIGVVDFQGCFYILDKDGKCVHCSRRR